MHNLGAVYDATQAVLSTFRLDEVLRHVLSVLRDHFDLRHTAVLLLDERSRELYLASEEGWIAQDGAIRVPLGRGIIGNAAEQRRCIYAPDVTSDPRYIPARPPTRSELAIPLIAGERLLGVIDCQEDYPASFDDETIDLLAMFAAHASIAIQNAELYTIEHRRATQLEAINAIARETSHVHEIQQLAEKVCARVLQAFDVEHVALLLAEGDALVLRAHAGSLIPVVIPELPFPSTAAQCGRAFTAACMIVENNVEPSSKFITLCSQVRSEAALPLIAMGQPLGVLVLDSIRSGVFQSNDLATLQAVADICAAAIQNANYFEQIRQLADRDGLTGVFNRRSFETRILEELARAERYGSALSVVMLDIDHFKELNDDFGHLIGDEILRQVSALFSQLLRKTDILSRFGGDEFAILLPEAPSAQAVAVAEKLRQKLAAMELPGVPQPVTLTAGVASVPQNGITRDELIKAADDALYGAKQAGRNCVVAAPFSMRAAKAAKTLSKAAQ